MAASIECRGDMIRRAIPKTGETLPVIDLAPGGVRVGAAGEDHRACLDLLLNAGGGMIDASPMYGRAESVVGELLAKRLELGLCVYRDKGLDRRTRSRHRTDGGIAQAAAAGSIDLDADSQID